jgi:hypothetical protein
MSKKTLIHFSNERFNNIAEYKSTNQTRNNLIATTNNHIRKNVRNNNILNVKSQADYTQYINNKGSSLVRTPLNIKDNSAQQFTYSQENKIGSFMKLNNKKFNPIIVNTNINSYIDVYATSVEPLNTQMFENKTIMVYSHFSKNGKIDSYNYYMINFFMNLVDTVCILSNMSKDKWNLSKHNVHILNYDFKSDFSNLYVFLLRYQVFINKINRLFFINDSFVVVNKTVFEHKIKEDFFSAKPSENYQGLVLSNAHNIHYQSYFLCIKHEIINRFIEYFKKYKNPLNHIDAINKYELGLSREFINRHIKYICYNNNPTALYPYEIIRKYGIIKRQQLLSTYNIKTQLTYNQIQQLKITYKDNNELIEYINNYSIKR